MSIATTTPSTAAARSSSAGRHHSRLNRLRDQERQRRGMVVALGSIGLLIVLAAALSVADFVWELSAGARLGGWIAIVAMLAATLVSTRRWTTFQDRDAVGATERAYPVIGQRLRTSHDYHSRPEQVTPANPQLLAALENETEHQVIEHVTEPLGRPWWPLAFACGIGLSLMVWLAALLVIPEWRVSTARLVMLPAQYSTVHIGTIPEFIDQGDDLVIPVRVDGRPVTTARVLYRSKPESENPQSDKPESEWNEAFFEPASENASSTLIDELSVVLPDRQRDTELRIEVGNHRSGIVPVDVRVPLVLEEWKLTVEPPSYTGLPVSEGGPDGVSVPEGSLVTLSARYNRPPAKVEAIDVSSDSQSISASIEQGQVRFSLTAAAPAIDLTIQALAEDGVEDASVLHVDVVADQPPRLKFVAPDAQSEALPTAEILLSLEAGDDYGLSNVGIRYRVDEGETKTLWESDAIDRVELVNTVTLALEELDLSYPQAITYYAYARDTRAAGPSREVTSQLQFLDIRPFFREYQFQDSNCKGSCEGECLTLEKLIKEQRDILGRTFVVARRDESVPGIGVKLAEQQDALLEKTDSLTAALEEKLGPMPALDRAIRAMVAAVEDLNAEEIAAGQVDEENALAGLIAARQNLRKILKQSNSQAKMCRNVDQQQLDKIRKPEREKESKQEEESEQLTRIREQLENLAKQQQSFCQSAKACSQSSASNSPSNPSTSEPSSADSQEQREQLVQQQQQAAEQVAQLQQELAQSRFGELAPKRAGQAEDNIRKSGDSFASQQGDAEAIERARRAAEQLKALSEHLARRHDPDFTDKLAAAKREAARLAQQQDDLSEQVRAAGSADDSEQSEQQQLAARSEELADLVDQLQSDSLDEDWQVQRELTEQISAHPPRAAAAEMSLATEHMKQGDGREAAERGSRAAASLKRFAAGLEQIQEALGPAELEKLTEAEAKAASLRKDLKQASSQAEKLLTRSQSAEFGDSLRAFTRGDEELKEAANRLAGGNLSLDDEPRERSDEEPSDQEPQFGESPQTLAEGLRRVDEILQRRIQDAILSGALQQSDGNVPPQYVDMVEEYYRTLSEDIE